MISTTPAQQEFVYRMWYNTKFRESLNKKEQWITRAVVLRGEYSTDDRDILNIVRDKWINFKH